MLPPHQRTSLHGRVVAAYFLGAVLGASLTALLAWLASGFLEPVDRLVRLVAVLVTAGIVWAAKSGPLVGRFRLPEARRQIPAEVFGGSLVRGAWRFGLEMGTGMRTYVPSIAPYVLFIGLVLARPTLAETLLVALGFGMGRTLPLLIAARPGRHLVAATRMLRLADHRMARWSTGLAVLIGVAAIV